MTEYLVLPRQKLHRLVKPGKGNNRVSWNANTYLDKGEKGKGKSKTPEQRDGERERLRRWEHDNR